VVACVGRDLVLRVNGVDLLSLSFTKTYFAPCSFTQRDAHSAPACPAFFAPHISSEIQPVHEPPAGEAMEAASKASAGKKKKRDFMGSLLKGVASSLARANSGSHNAKNLSSRRVIGNLRYTMKQVERTDGASFENDLH
jgi:hypothetical protein